MPSADNDTTIEETAYHEAGHAILALAFGIDVPELSIVPAEDWLGGCGLDNELKFLVHVQQIGNLVDMKLSLLRFVSFLAAGRRAQRTFLICRGLVVDEEKLDNEARIDFELMAPKVASLKEIVSEFDIEDLLPKIDTYLSREDVWPVVQTLAAELLKAREINGVTLSDYPVPPLTLL